MKQLLKKLMENSDVIGGIFGVIAIIAIIFEMAISGFDSASVAGGIKDIAETLATIVLMLTAVKALTAKKAKSFRGAVETRMQKIETKYAPLIRKASVKDTAEETQSVQNKKNKLQQVIRYEIATKIEVMFGEECKNYIRLFDVAENEPTEIRFYIRESFFGNTTDLPYNPEKIAENIYGYLSGKFKEYTVERNVKGKDGEIIVKFNKNLSTDDDIDKLSALIDTTILLYIAEYKKS